MGSISALHGITLSAWAFAGLTGNQLANWIVSKFSEATTGYQTVLLVTGVLYIVAFLISMFMVRPIKENKEEK